MQVEIAHDRANLIQLVGRRAMGGIVLLTPQHAEFTGHAGEIGGQGAATAHFAAVEPGVAYAIGLDVNGFFRDTFRRAQHVDEQIVSADFPEQHFVVASGSVTAGWPISVGLRRQAGSGDQAEMRHPVAKPRGHICGNRTAK